MKYILCGCIIIGFTYIGMCIRNGLSARHKLLTEICSFIDDFTVNLGYSKLSLSDFIKTKNCTTGFYKYLLDYYNGKISGVAQFKQLKALTETENQQLIEFLEKIGSTDTMGQLEILGNYKQVYNSLLIGSKTKKDKYGSLAVKMSVLLGLLVVILCL